MLAEAALRNWTTGSVEQYYIDGIRASMDYYNIDEAKKQAYIDGLKNKQESLERDHHPKMDFDLPERQ